MPLPETVRPEASKSPVCREGRTARMEKILCSASCVLSETGFPSMISLAVTWDALIRIIRGDEIKKRIKVKA